MAPTAPPPILPSQQVIKRIEIVELKSLRDVTIELNEAPLSAIMGGNCSGKTTVLHALACAYGPLTSGDPNYKFPHFFKPNTDSRWNGSAFSIIYSQRLGAATPADQITQYTKQINRWAPRYEKRPKRSVRFVSIRDSVPDLEDIKLNSMVHYTRTAQPDAVSTRIRDTAGQVLNRTYTAFDEVRYQYGGKRSVGVAVGQLSYAGIAMSSGEQRVFRIIETVFRAPAYSLILIDEIDLFLHQDALSKLLRALVTHCSATNKQLVFTTHFPPVADMYDQVAISTLHRVPARTLIWKGYSYEALKHMTGTQQRPISVYVEDDVAEAIVSKLGSDLGIRKFMAIGRYGPAANAFSLGAGLILSNVSTDHTLMVLDGDEYALKGDRREQVNKKLTGTAPANDDQRRQLLSMVKCLLSDRGLAPEQMLHRMLHSITNTGLDSESTELLRLAQAVHNVPNKHDYVNAIIKDSGESRDVALSKLVKLASSSADWPRYTRLVHLWLKKQKADLHL